MIKIEVENGKAKLYTPYNAEFVKAVKNIGGAKWNGSCWSVPEESLNAAREIMERIYGYSDITPDETVTLRITCNEELFARCASVSIFGKTLAHAWGRDSGAKVGEDVSLISGEIRSGGSVKNWRSVVTEGSVFVLTNVNKRVYESFTNDENFDITVELLENKISKSKLLEKKENLLKRIAEINEILNGMEE